MSGSKPPPVCSACGHPMVYGGARGWHCLNFECKKALQYGREEKKTKSKDTAKKLEEAVKNIWK